MKKSILFTIFTFYSFVLLGQNATDKFILSEDDGPMFGAYGEVHFNQPMPMEDNVASLDVHRLVWLMGYKFNERTTFAAELEFEHVKEVYVEQAFLNYSINDYINFKTGLILSPMGIINSYHEPVTFNGVERPNVDKYIIPSTWREIGAGIHGRLLDLNLNYQLYVMNGFNGYDDGAKFSGSSGLRGGRQKGAESFMSSPNFTGRLDYFGIPNLKIGISGYFGDSQSTEINNDSTIVGIMMMGADFRYFKKNLQIRGQYIMTDLSNTGQYNIYSGKDLGSQMNGYYFELGYDIMSILNSSSDQKLVAFSRYESYNTHADTEGDLEINDSYNRSEITMGLSWHVADGAVFKADYQIMDDSSDVERDNKFNLGFGVWF